MTEVPRDRFLVALHVLACLLALAALYLITTLNPDDLRFDLIYRNF